MKINRRSLDKIKEYLYGKNPNIVYPTKEEVLQAVKSLEWCEPVASWATYEGKELFWYIKHKSPKGKRRITFVALEYGDEEAAIDLAFRLKNPEERTPNMDILPTHEIPVRERKIERIDVKSFVRGVQDFKISIGIPNEN